MKKKYLLALFFLVISAASGFIFVKTWRGSVFTCTADVEFSVLRDGQKIRLDSDYDFVIGSDNKASINVSGTFFINDHKYDLNRTYFLDYAKKTGDTYYTFTMTHAEVHKLDNTPGDIFETYFIAQRASIPFFIKISQLNNDLYLVESLKRTYFTCLRQ